MTKQRDIREPGTAPAVAGVRVLTRPDSKPKGKRGGARGERPSPSRDAILAVIERAGAAGASQAEIRAATDFRPTAVWSLMHMHGKAGVWFAGGIHGSKRYFARRDWADVFDKEQRAKAEAQRQAKERAEQARQESSTGRSPLIEAFARAAQARKVSNPKPWRSELPPVLTPAPRGPVEIVRPAGVEVQRGPSLSYDPRYQLDPDKKVRGDFTRLGIGRYLEA